jgi:hypothetical protein
MAVEVIEANGISALVSCVLNIASSLPGGRFLWFRGLNKSHYPLIPKLMRFGKSGEAVLERERRLLTRFRQRSLAFWPAGYPQDDWEHLFAMQHFGIPTRLLDWSENLFVAAHFAIATANSEDATPTVWCVDPVAWNQAMPGLSEYGDSIHVLTTADEEAESYRPLTNKRRGKSPVALFGTHNSNRIVAQRGTFIVWGNEPRSMEDFSGENDATLWKFEIRGETTELAYSLRALGFGETMIFPELTSLAEELTRTETWRA